ncbi:MAG: guanylate kinase [Acidobacteriota bacterium]
MSNRGNLIIISAPSGSGKTSLASRALREIPGLKFSVSYTTRRPRRGEKQGVEYFFVSQSEFEERILQKGFLEYAHVYGHYYGTSRSFVESEVEAGNDVLLDIDVQGALKVKREIPDAVLVFVLPPSLQTLEERLRTRGLDDPEVIEKRLRIAREEIQHYPEYHYAIVNDVIEESLNELKWIILAARCRIGRRSDQVSQIVKTFAAKPQGEQG